MKTTTATTILGGRDPWSWAALVSFLVVTWNVREWRHAHQRAEVLRTRLGAVEQDYVRVNRQFKHARTQRRRLLTDVERLERDNAKWQGVLQEYEGRTLQSPQQSAERRRRSLDAVNVDSSIDAEEEEEEQRRREELYLTRMDQVQDQLMRWNERRLLHELGNRFPTFRVTVQDVDDEATTTTRQFQMRCNVRRHPVEIALLWYEVIKTQRLDGLTLEISSDGVYDGNEDRLRLRYRQDPLPQFPTWPIPSDVYLRKHPDNDSWLVVLEDPASSSSSSLHSLLSSQPSPTVNRTAMDSASSSSPPIPHAAHIFKGYDFLNEYRRRDSDNDNNNDENNDNKNNVLWRLRVVAAEQVVPRRIIANRPAAGAAESRWEAEQRLKRGPL